MAQEEIRLRSPKIAEIKPVKLAIDQMINDGADVQLTEAQAVIVVDVIDWVINFLDNRKTYHRKRNYTMKEEIRLMEAALSTKGFDINHIKREAAGLVADKVVDESESDA